VRSRLAWLLGLAGLFAFLRRRHAPQPVVEAGPDARALELRRVLDESRPEEATPAETPAEGELDDRRRQVHDAGRAAMEEMRRGPKPAD
jgi:hypothetical protein